MPIDDDTGECTQSENDSDVYLSDHSRFMRQACSYCITVFDRLEGPNASASSDSNPNSNSKSRNPENHNLLSLLHCRHDKLFNKLRKMSEEHRSRRTKAHRNFWRSSSFSYSTTSKKNENISADADTPISVAIDTMTVRLVNDEKDGNKDNIPQQALCLEQVRYFHDHFLNLNLPCLIKGLDRSHHFEFVNRNWRTSSASCNEDNGTTSNCNSLLKEQQEQNSRASLRSRRNFSSSKVNRQWFRDELGDSFLVPVRYSPHNYESTEDDHRDTESSLDEDGRATECETRKVPIREWIEMLKMVQLEPCTDNNRTKENLNERESNLIHYYLKDWHLQQRFPPVISDPPEIGKSPRLDSKNCFDCALYSCPEYFGYDLLNSFLTRFTAGDYRFCYWGPSRSFTARHSDVLHSFSWSYNVVGTKEWTFYYSQDPGNQIAEGKDGSDLKGGYRSDDSLEEKVTKTFTIIQETGQTIFVPATWQHRVVNLEETISVNHNWITSSNLDLVWDCIRVEMTAIQNELQGWDEGMDENMEACENMLRGCIGLDVTSFVLMTLVRVLDILIALVEEDADSSRCIGKQSERHLFDVFRLTSVLQDVVATKGNLLQLRNRFHAILQSHPLTEKLENMVERVIRWINH